MEKHLAQSFNVEQIVRAAVIITIINNNVKCEIHFLLFCSYTKIAMPNTGGFLCSRYCVNKHLSNLREPCEDVSSPCCTDGEMEAQSKDITS